MIFLGVGEKRGLKEKWGPAAALQIWHHFIEHRRNVSHHTDRYLQNP